MSEDNKKLPNPKRDFWLWVFTVVIVIFEDEIGATDYYTYGAVKLCAYFGWIYVLYQYYRLKGLGDVDKRTR